MNEERITDEDLEEIKNTVFKKWLEGFMVGVIVMGVFMIIVLLVAYWWVVG